MLAACEAKVVSNETFTCNLTQLKYKYLKPSV